jgi:hypothetical protein
MLAEQTNILNCNFTFSEATFQPAAAAGLALVASWLTDDQARSLMI